ncbi:MAG: hypothetical protein FJ102_14070 [Deltaproteobacteria bacterium]|nr:hypothetical protein [Deltaproteobacteria bacterium]
MSRFASGHEERCAAFLQEPGRARTAAHCVWREGDTLAHAWLRFHGGPEIDTVAEVDPAFPAAAGDARWLADHAGLRLPSPSTLPPLRACTRLPAEVVLPRDPGHRSPLLPSPGGLFLAPALRPAAGDSGSPWIDPVENCVAAVHLGLLADGTPLGKGAGG